MIMRSNGTMQGITQVIPPKENHYLLRMKSLELAQQKLPDSPILPFLVLIVNAQNQVFQNLQSHPSQHPHNSHEPFITSQSLSHHFSAIPIELSKLLIELLTDNNSSGYSEVIKILHQLIDELTDDAKSQQYFHQIMALNLEEIPAPKRIFLLTAMQVLLHFKAHNCNINPDYLIQNKEQCPCCQMPAISSVLDNSENGLRYLYCSFCETKWHVVRSNCTNCHSNQSLYQNKIEALNSNMYAEVCNECHSYLKFIDRTKTSYSDPFIEDLMTLPLAINLSNEQYQTFGLNPYLA